MDWLAAALEEELLSKKPEDIHAYMYMYMYNVGYSQNFCNNARICDDPDRAY